MNTIEHLIAIRTVCEHPLILIMQYKSKSQSCVLTA